MSRVRGIRELVKIDITKLNELTSHSIEITHDGWLDKFLRNSIREFTVSRGLVTIDFGIDYEDLEESGYTKLVVRKAINVIMNECELSA